MIITLTEEEMKWASAYGAARTNENKNRNDIPEYRQSAFNLTSLQANKLGVAVEMAFVKWMGFPVEVLKNERPDIWAGFVTENDYHMLGQPDIIGVLECRRANKKSSPIPIRRKDVKGGAIVVQAYMPYTQQTNGMISPSREIELLGWSDAKADWATATQPWWGNGTSRIAAERKPMETLNPEDIFERAGVLL